MIHSSDMERGSVVSRAFLDFVQECRGEHSTEKIRKKQAQSRIRGAQAGRQATSGTFWPSDPP